MSVYFGGISLAFSPREQDLEGWISDHIPTDEMIDLVESPYSGIAYPWFNAALLPSPDIKLGHLIWPQKASAFACGHFLASDRILNLIRPLAYADDTLNALEFTASDGKRTITTDLYMLTPHLLGRRGVSGNGLWLLTLVDERFFWAGVGARVTVSGGSTTWEDLFGDIGTALGVSIAVDTIDAAFLDPSPGLTSNYDSLPLLLDAAAACVGMRFVRTLDGTCSIQSATNATTSVAEQIALAYPKTAGGQWALDATFPPTDLNTRVPAEVVFRFPRSDDTIIVDDFYASTTTLASLAITRYGDATGYDSQRVVSTTSLANYTASVLDNGAELDALTEAWAEQFYLWAAIGHDIVFQGVTPWVPEGATAQIEWAFLPDRTGTECRFRTRIQTGDDFTANLYHYGSASAVDTGWAWIEGNLRYGTFPSSGGGTATVVTAYPVTGTGTGANPVTFVDGNSSGQLFVWNPGGGTWALTTNPSFTFDTSTLTLNTDSVYLTQTGTTSSKTLTLSSNVISTLGMVSTLSVTTAQPITGVGTTVDPVRLANGTKAGQVPAWNGTTTWTQTSTPIFNMTSTGNTGTFTFNSDASQFTQTGTSATNQTLTLSSAMIASLALASSTANYTVATVRDGANTIGAISTQSGSTITANSNGVIPAVDGITLQNGSIIFIQPANNSAQVNNGAWTVIDIGSAGTPFVLNRVPAMTTSAQSVPGITFTVGQGTTYANQALELTTSAATLNTTPITFAQAAQEIASTETYLPRQVGVRKYENSTVRSTASGTVSDWMAMDGGWLGSTATFGLASSASSISLLNTGSRVILGLVPSGSGTGLSFIDDNSENNRIVFILNRSTSESLALNSTASVNGLLTASDATETLAPRSMALGIFDTTLSPDRWRVQMLGGSESLNALTDVSLSGSIVNGDALVFNSTINLWTNVPAPGISPIALNDLTDVVAASPSANDFLVYNGADWTNQTLVSITSAILNITDLADVHAPTPATGDALLWNGAGLYVPGDPKAAIVEDGRGGYVGLSCVESPDVRFEMVTEVQFTGTWSLTTPIDPLFLTVCEPDSIVPISLVSAVPAVLGASVEHGDLLIESQSHLTSKVWVKLSGIRKGFAGNRFPKHTREEMEANNRFWGGWKVS